MLDETKLIRAVAFPKHFPDGALAAEALFCFGKSDENSKVLSIGLGHLLQDQASLAAFGCATITAMNVSQTERAVAAGKASELQEFVGYYTSTYGALKSIVDPEHTIAAYWQKEGNIREHGHIEYRSNGSEFSTKREGSRARRSLESKIVKTFAGPFRVGQDSTQSLVPGCAWIDLPSLPFSNDQ